MKSLRSTFARVMSAAFCLCLLGAGLLRLGAKDAALEELPVAVRATVEKLAAHGEIEEIEIEIEDGVEVYEVEVRSDDGVVEYVLDADGSVLEVEIDDDDGDDDEHEDEEEETQISIDELPSAVRSVVDEFVGGNSIKEVVRERDDDAIIYEVEYEVDGVEHSIELSEDGDLLELEHAIDIGELPERVRRELEEEFPGAEISEAEAVQVFFYEIELIHDGERFEVEMTATGEMDDDDHEDHDDEDDDDDDDDDD